MNQVTGPEDLLGAAGRGAQGFRTTDVTAQKERFLWRAGAGRLRNAVTSPEGAPSECSFQVLLDVQWREGAWGDGCLYVGGKTGVQTKPVQALRDRVMLYQQLKGLACLANQFLHLKSNQRAEQQQAGGMQMTGDRGDTGNGPQESERVQ